jgi:hypothetical protein
LSITRQGIAKHLALLADAGLVTSDAGCGRRVLYRHRSEPIKVARSYLAALAADWDGALDRLSAFLAAPRQPLEILVNNTEVLEQPTSQTVRLERIMHDQDFTTTFTVDQTPEDVFAAINDVRGWWTGEIEGGTDKLGDEFTYRYQDIHYSRQRITKLVPGERVVWLVLDAHLDFTEDKSEWKGTEISFEISRRGEGTEVRFTHVGLAPEVECFDACSNAWGFYISGSLRSLITTGKGSPTRN